MQITCLLDIEQFKDYSYNLKFIDNTRKVVDSTHKNDVILSKKLNRLLTDLNCDI